MAARAPTNDERPATVDAPSRRRVIRMGLLTKLNLLAVGLIVATAIGVSVLLVAQQIEAEQARLKTQGQTIVNMLADLSEYAVYTADLSALERLLQSLEGDRDIAYAAVLDDQGHLIASRGYGDAAMPPAPASELHPGAVESSVRQVRGRRYLELVAPIAETANERPPAATGSPAPADPPIGYVRLGLNYERNQALLHSNVIGALSVVAAGAAALFRSSSPVLSPNCGTSSRPSMWSMLNIELAIGVPSAALTCTPPFNRPPA
jgi:hypothetical protein